MKKEQSGPFTIETNSLGTLAELRFNGKVILACDIARLDDLRDVVAKIQGKYQQQPNWDHWQCG